MGYPETETALTLGMTISDLVAIYRKAEDDIRAGFGLVGGAIDAMNAAFVDRLYLRGRHNDFRADWHAPDEVFVELRRSIWGSLIDRTQIRKAMSIAAWDALLKEIKEGDPPEITEENVAGMVARFRTDAPEMLRAAVREVFEFLRPRSSEYKTNTEFELGERVILKHYVSRGFGSRWDVDYQRSQHLIALENVFGALAGKLSDQGSKSNLERAIEAIPNGQPCVGETDLFAFRGHKNQTLHLRMKRMDLVAKLNAVAGGARLKPSAGGAP